MPDISIHKESLPIDLFERLLRAVREVGEERLRETYVTNFWFPINIDARNVVEEVIWTLRPLVNPGIGCVGVEWWLGRLPYGKSLPLHFDRDMTLQNETGQTAHPIWSSILYLNRFPSSPTVILDQVWSEKKKALHPRTARSGKAVYPEPNQYVVYPGNLYHGVIADKDLNLHGRRAKKSRRPTEPRMSLLINFWDRRPLPPVCRDYDGSVYGALKKGY